MSRVTYHSAIELVESYKITYRIYVLKNPNTNTVFYVGKTMKEQKIHIEQIGKPVPIGDTTIRGMLITKKNKLKLQI